MSLTNRVVRAAIIVMVLVASVCGLMAQGMLVPVYLRCEDRVSPLGIGNPKLELLQPASWPQTWLTWNLTLPSPIREQLLRLCGYYHIRNGKHCAAGNREYGLIDRTNQLHNKSRRPVARTPIRAPKHNPSLAADCLVH